jgi:apolipoprotein N-acyltransferase
VTFPRLLAALMGGALYGLPFVDPSLGPLAFVGMAPVLMVLANGTAGALALVAVSFLTVATSAWLIALPLAQVSWLAPLLLGGFIFPWAWAGLMAFAILRRLTGSPLALLWPCCWIVAEWGWSFHSIGRLAFGLSGYTLFRWPVLIQMADMTGVLGVSFLLQAVVGALADLGLAWGARPGKAALRAARGSLVAVAGFLVVGVCYGALRLAMARPAPGPRLALIQPALRHSLAPSQGRLVQYRQVGLARTHVEPGKADLVVFPENAVLGVIDETPYLREFQELSAELRAPVLVGVNTDTEANAERVRRGLPVERIRVGSRIYRPGYNSAAVITPQGIVAKYDKRHLLPFTEQVPGEAFFKAIGLLDRYHEFVTRVLGYIGDGVPGQSTRLLTVPGTAYPPYWTPVCFEQADARLARDAALQGARSFINITSEGDLGPQIYWNTTAVAVLRAVELHVGIARCGNMGITGIIDPWGRETRHLRGKRGGLWGEPGVLEARLPMGPATPTLYARLGDWPAGAAALWLACTALAALRRRGRPGPEGGA